MNAFYTLTVRGNLVEVQAKLLNIKYLVDARREEGWKPFQSDETWIYFAMPTGACPVCKAFAAQRSFNGTIMQMNFPMSERYVGIRKRLPRVHRNRPWLKGFCRCNIEWKDPVGTLERRLGREMKTVSEKLAMFP